MPVLAFRDKEPQLGQRAWIAPSAHVVGDVVLGDDASVWFGSVVRGDVNSIRVGARSNVRDGTVVHVTHDTHPTKIGDDVVIGHQAVIHGCTLEDACLVGIGARVLDGAVVESGAQVGAGAVVTPGTRVEAGWLALGIPARPVRRLSDGERDNIAAIAERYARLKEHYRLDGRNESERDTSDG